MEETSCERLSAAAVLQFAAREAREGRRLHEFGAQAFATITYNAYGIFLLLSLVTRTKIIKTFIKTVLRIVGVLSCYNLSDSLSYKAL